MITKKFTTINNLSKQQGQQHQGAGGPCPPPTFRHTKKKREAKEKKQRVSRQKLLKGCHQGQNVTVAILEHLEFKKFPCQPTMVAENTFQCSMAPLF